MSTTTTRIQVVKDASIEHGTEGWRTHLQWVNYIIGPLTHTGYRVILSRPNGSLQPARGQARIISQDHLRQLWAIATKEGWGDYEGSTTSEE